MTPDPLTPRQKEVLDFLQRFIDEHGYAPSMAEVCTGMQLTSTATAHKLVQTLREKGYLDAQPRRSRGLTMKTRPLELTGLPSVDVPLLGRVAAGQPIEHNATPGVISIPEWMLGRGETYVLEVKGDSMIDEAIKDGDLVIVEKRDHAENGEMVIACIDNETVTMKRLYREHRRIRLQPSNPAMAPIIVENRHVTVSGVVIGVLRKYRRW
ncbi:MAG TPA: transcriptional repressor LexA [Candidatus Ozemobacteraceae bacterium]|nr:transcriptional repressor LexA [Candidatus Ozemobacteraceae bacterium]